MDDHGRATRRRVIGSLGAAAAAGMPAAAFAQGTPAAGGDDRMRVVLHVGEPDGWAPALSNLDNLTRLHPDGEYRLVVDGTAVYVISGASDVTARLETVAAKGVTVLVCPNALEEHGIAPSQLPGHVDATVPGVVAIVQAARDGLIYVKP